MYIFGKIIENDIVEGLMIDSTDGYQGGCWKIIDMNLVKTKDLEDNFIQPMAFQTMEVLYQTPLSNLDHKPYFIDKIKKLVDNRHSYAESLVAGDLSIAQVERYQTKYKKALEGDDKYFNQEAKLKGVKSSTIKGRVLKKGEALIQAKEAIISSIEAVRVAVMDLIEKTDSKEECETILANLYNLKDWEKFEDIATLQVEIPDEVMEEVEEIIEEEPVISREDEEALDDIERAKINKSDEKESE